MNYEDSPGGSNGFMRPSFPPSLSPQDREVSTEEFRCALKRACVGRAFPDLPEAFRAYVNSAYRTIDINGKTHRQHQQFICSVDRLRSQISSNSGSLYRVSHMISLRTWVGLT